MAGSTFAAYYNCPITDDFSVAPVSLLYWETPRTNAGLPMLRRYNYELRQQAYFLGLASATLLMHLAATSLGLGSQWVSGVTWPYVHCSLKPLLGIPHHMDAYDMMAVGFFRVQTSRQIITRQR